MINNNLGPISSYEQLFKYTHFSLKVAKMIGPYSVFIVGGVRQGKSSTFNLINDPNIIVGLGNEEESQYMLRDPKQLNPETSVALVKTGYASVTLIPNITVITHKGKKITLIDLPGYFQNRSKNEMMMINFIIKSCYMHAQNTRFIFVISDKQFTSEDGKEFRNLFTIFVSFIDLFGLSPEQKKSIYKSIGIFISSVKLDKTYEEKKRFRLQKLAKNLKHIEQMSQSNAEIKRLFPLLNEMIMDIIEGQRLELFELAKDKKSPTHFDLLSRLSDNGWTDTNLKDIPGSIKSCYSEQFKTLSSSDQQQIRLCIMKKMKTFDTFSCLIVDIINRFIKDPLTRGIQLAEQYQRLEEFLEQLRVHEEIPHFTEQEQLIEQNCSSIDRLNSIKKFDQFSHQITNDYDRKPDDREKRNYFKYLKEEFFEPSMRQIKKCFTLTNKHMFIIDTLMGIFDESFEQLKFISEIDAGTISDCHHRLKEAILFINKIDDSWVEIVSIFIEKLRQERDFYNCSTKEIKEIIDFVCKIQVSEQTNHKIIYEQRYKLYNCLAKRKDEQDEFKDSESTNASEEAIQPIQFIIHSTISRIIFQFCNKIEKEKEKGKGKIEKEQENINQYPNWQEEFADFQMEFILITLEGFTVFNVCQVLLNFAFFDETFKIIQQAIKKAASKKNHNFQIQLMKKLAQIHLLCGNRRSHNDQLDKIVKKLNSMIPKDNHQIKYAEERKKEAQNKHLQVYKDNEEETDRKRQEKKNSPCEHYLTFLRQIWKMIHKDTEFPLKKSLFDQIRQSYEAQIKKKQRYHQFFVELPKNITSHQVLKYTQYLLGKISKDHKATILIGMRHTGKTTLFYSLCNKKLVIKPIGSSHYYELSEKCGERSRINHSGACPTEVPNIYSISDNQIVIDTPNLLSVDPYKEIIYRYLFTQLLKRCKECKFILVIDQEDILQNNCAHLFKWILLYHSLFNNQNDSVKEVSMNAIAYIFNFVQKQSRQKIRKVIRAVKDQLANKKNIKNTAEKYGLDMNQVFLCEAYFSVILAKSSFFMKASQTVENQINFTYPNWSYIEVTQSKLNIQFKKYCVELKQDVEKDLERELKGKWEFILSIIRNDIHNIFSVLDQPQSQRREQSFQNMKQSINKVLNGRNIDRYLTKLKENSTKKQLEIGQIEFVRKQLTPQRQVIRQYFLYQKMSAILANSDFNMRSSIIFEKMSELFYIWNDLLCKSDQQYNIFLKAQVLFRSFLEEIVIIANFVNQIQYHNNFIYEIYKDLVDVWYNSLPLEKKIKINYATYLQMISLEDYENESDSDDATLVNFLKIGLNKVGQLSLENLEILMSFFGFLESKFKKNQKYQELCVLYVKKIQIIDKIIEKDQQRQKKDKDNNKVKTMKELAVYLSYFDPVLSLRICTLLKCNSTRLKVHKNLENAQSVYMFLDFNPSQLSIQKDDAYFQIIDYCLSISRDEDLTLSLNMLKMEEQPQRLAYRSVYTRTRDVEFISECAELINEIDSFFNQLQ